MTKAFYAHSTNDYNTEFESLAILQIKRLLKDIEIINPKDLPKPEHIKNNQLYKLEHEVYFPIINKCDVLIATRCWNRINKRGKFSEGVLLEINYALAQNKKVYELGA